VWGFSGGIGARDVEHRDISHSFIAENQTNLAHRLGPVNRTWTEAARQYDRHYPEEEQRRIIPRLAGTELAGMQVRRQNNSASSVIAADESLGRGCLVVADTCICQLLGYRCSEATPPEQDLHGAAGQAYLGRSNWFPEQHRGTSLDSDARQAVRRSADQIDTSSTRMPHKVYY